MSTLSMRGRWLAGVALTAALVTTLSGCFLLPEGSSEKPDGEETASAAFAEYFDQELDWKACGDLECASMNVPIDWEDEESDSVEIALAKQPAFDKSQGTIFVNPGGPGGSGVGFVEYAVSDDLADSFDIVGWDPRGVGDSTPVECYNDKDKDESLYGTFDEPYQTEAWIDELTGELEDYAAACEKNTGALLGKLDTVSTAHDLELMRALIAGDEPLDYLGYSYGTFIGAVYAELFPDNVGHLVLDGAIDPTVGAFDELVVQAVGFEDNLRAYMVDCLTRECPFTGPLDSALQQASALIGSVDGAGLVSADGRELDSATVGTGVAFSLYSPDYWEYLTDLFTGLQTGDPEWSFILADAYNGRDDDGSYADNSVEVYQATTCVDNDWTSDSASTLDRMQQITDAAPTIGPYLTLDDYAVLDVLCNNWPYPAADFPDEYDAEGAAPILVIGTTNDPATPYIWAQALAKQLSSGVLITVEGDGHTAYNGDNGCVNSVVDEYFLDGTVPDEDPEC
jgi:pimeloyl-ACP methyl ester carboxylesterase